MLYQFLISVWRTVAPMLAGLVCTLAAKWGLGLDNGQVLAGLTTAFSALYYMVFRLLEHAHPGWGWFLGFARPPLYERRDGGS